MSSSSTPGTADGNKSLLQKEIPDPKNQRAKINITPLHVVLYHRLVQARKKYG
jgi:hypothetical protein